MSRGVIYKRYSITSSPAQDPATSQWRLNISISVENEGKTISKAYWMPITYSTEAEADIHGIAFGQRIIDGKVAGLSLE